MPRKQSITALKEELDEQLAMPFEALAMAQMAIEDEQKEEEVKPKAKRQPFKINTKKAKEEVKPVIEVVISKDAPPLVKVEEVEPKAKRQPKAKAEEKPKADMIEVDANEEIILRRAEYQAMVAEIAELRALKAEVERQKEAKRTRHTNRQKAKKEGTYVPKRGGGKAKSALDEEAVRKIAREEALKAKENTVVEAEDEAEAEDEDEEEEGSDEE